MGKGEKRRLVTRTSIGALRVSRDEDVEVSYCSRKNAGILPPSCAVR
jgi:hypothetical protein